MMTRQSEYIATNVKAARKKIPGLTQEALARKAGVSVRTVSRLEQAKTEYPRADEFERIAAALNTTVAALRRVPAGHADSPTPGPPDPLVERLRRVFGPQDVNVITDWLDETEGYTLEDKTFTVRTVEWLQQVMRGARDYRGARGPSPSAGRTFAPQGTR